jgi:hypothetical protein
MFPVVKQKIARFIRNSSATDLRYSDLKNLQAKSPNAILKSASELPDYYSQADEDSILLTCLETIGVTNPGTFIEIGVGNGFQNNTLMLAIMGWRGKWLSNQDLDLRLKQDNSRITFNKTFVDTENILELLSFDKQAPNTNLDVFSIDIDGNDYYLVQKLLNNDYRPKIFIIEYNSQIPLGVSWINGYQQDFQRAYKSVMYGASYTAFQNLLSLHNYTIVACSSSGVNLFAINNELFTNSRLSGLNLSPRQIYVAPNYDYARITKPGYKLTGEFLLSLLE